MRERPAFRSTFAKHALDRGRGISRARPRHKALLGKPGGDGAKAAAVIELASPTSPIRPPLAVEKRLFQQESPYKSAPASPKTAAVPTSPIAVAVVF